ncbi:SDR family NAD(P)-dependent oxidoreductase [Planomonospora sp. ID91781]|uniref:type I polyketide synthase n=1 Tax=Planomonospora sp. ID91781 TaxID=2738135 RepID=UPI0018C3F89A|nr:type I polyketide synthase [Planomonospora sp. ID91781]MBG0819433.1 SDR family NAD(P)-dependent oxidoreductase [Planomonospora sp. ID91781]
MDLLGEDDIRRFLSERIAARCRLPLADVDADRPLEEFGLSSRDAVAVAGELEALLGRALGPTLVWEYPTIDRLARGLAARTTGPASQAVRRAASGEPVAVVGLGCRLPGSVRGPDDLWRLLLAGGDAVGEVPEGRWEEFDDGSPRTAEALARTTRHGGFLDDVAGFDADFFGIVPGEAETMDPQQRLLLETAWEALEHAGIAPRSLRGSRTGVFAGVSGHEYAYLTTADVSRVDAWTATGAASSIAANRLSYLLDLRGPSLAVDTACSSSLVAVDLAVRSLREGESDLALAAGVNLLLSPVVTMAFDRGGGTAPDGRCKAFDAAADGMVRAEGCGVAVLKRLSDALRDGDRVLAVVRATAVNQDGRSNGLVAPNPEAQEELLRAVYAGLEPPDYIEAHGTGTFLGDPIEARAIDAALPPGHRVLLGSAKSNLGHLEAAAGITGLIKTVLALHHGVVPPSVHFHRPNPHIPWDRLEVVTAPTPWPGGPGARPRAGVSSFGFGGTNAHVVLDAAPREPAVPPGAETGTEVGAGARGARVFLLTDASADRVREHAGRLVEWIGGAAAGLDDVARTLARRAGRGRAGAAVVARDARELAAGLRAVHEGRPAQGTAVGTAVGTAAGGRGPVWVFGGYGSQWAGMGKRLYTLEPVFAGVIDELDPLFRQEAGIPLKEVVAAGSDPGGVATAQPLIFAVQVALARLWNSHGVRPAAVVGHSMGEIAAAVVAGGIGLRDAVRVVCRRARLLGTLGGGGAMAVLEVAAEEVPADLHVAVHSSPRQCVVTGDPGRVAAFAAEVEARGLLSRLLTAEGAGHSPQVKPLLPRLRAELAGIEGGKPGIPFYSTVFDDPREIPVFEPAYWAAGVRRPVRLMAALRAAAEDGHTVFTEIGPHPVLAAALRDTLPAGTVVTHSLRRGHDEEFAAQLAAVAVALPSTELAPYGAVTDLPLPAWRHERHWVSAARRAALPPGAHPLLGTHVESPAGHVWTATVDDLADAPWRLDPAHWRVHGLPVLPLAAVAALAQAAAAQACGRAELTDVVLEGLLPLPAEVVTTVTPCGEVEIDARNAAGTWIRYGTATIVTDAPPAGAVPSPAELAARLHGRAEEEPCGGPAGTPGGGAGRTPDGGAVGGVSGGPAGTPDGWAGGGAGAEQGVPVPVEIGYLGPDGAPEDVRFRWVPATAVPVPLAAKLVGREWVEAPEAGIPDVSEADADAARSCADAARSWLLVAAEGDPRTGRLAAGLTGAGHTVHHALLPLPLRPPRTRPAAPRPFRAPNLVPLQRPAPHPAGAADPVPVVEGLEPVPVVEGSEPVRASGEAGPAPGADEVVVLVPAGLDPAGAEGVVLAVTRLVRDLTGDGSGTGARLRLATERAQAVLPGERADPGAAALRGLVRVLAFEHPGLRACLVDADDPAALLTELTPGTSGASSTSGVPEAHAVSGMHDMSGIRNVSGMRGASGGSDDEVAWRGGVRLAARLAALPLPAPPPPGTARPVVRRGESYLITGGYGGLGLVVARWLAERGAGRIVLGGRSGPGSSGIAAIEELRDLGTDVRLVIGDLAAPGTAGRMVDAAVAGGLRLRGVVHAAGVLDDRLVADVGAADLHRVWSAKVHGGLALHEATRGSGLDWWVAFSSAAALLGSPGQAAYAAANAWLDALCELRRAEGLPGTTVAWGTWAEVGGAGRAALPAVSPITPDEGVEALEALLVRGVPAAGVVRLDAAAAVAAFPGIARMPYFAELAGTAGGFGEGAGTGSGRPGAEALEDLDPDAAVAAITARLTERTAAVLGFERDRLREGTVLTEAGLDSLAATRVRGAVELDFGVTLPAALLLNGATLGDLAAAVAAELGVRAPEPPAGEPPAGPRRGGLLRRADPARHAGDAEETARGVVRPLNPAARAHLAGETGTGTPLFLAHAAGGTTEVYARLVELLGPGPAVFGLERLDGRGVAERAERYAEEIKRIRPEGPYRLGGWSFGGVLAFETARRLGELDVELVAMIDSGLPDETDPGERTRITARRYADFAAYLHETYGVPVELGYEELAVLDEDGQLALTEARVAASGVTGLLGEAILRHQVTSHADTRALEAYRPGVFTGRVILYRSTEPTPWAVHDVRYVHDGDPARGFGPYSPALEVVTVPGSHHLDLLDPPHVEVIAAHLAEHAGGQP